MNFHARQTADSLSSFNDIHWAGKGCSTGWREFAAAGFPLEITVDSNFRWESPVWDNTVYLKYNKKSNLLSFLCLSVFVPLLLCSFAPDSEIILELTPTKLQRQKEKKKPTVLLF